MCWNAQISLSTYVLGITGITIAYINKTEPVSWLIFYFTITTM